MTRDEWQPIETAPKDGSEILIYQDGHVFGHDFAIGRWVTPGYWSNRNSVGEYNRPTHWKPLDSPNE